MADIFKQFPDAIVARDEAAGKISVLENDQRKKDYLAIVTDIEKLDKEGQLLVYQLQKITAVAEQATQNTKIRALLEQRRLKEESARTIREEFEEFKEKNIALINKEMAKKTRILLNSITAEIAKYAANQGFDVVFDVSGLTNTQLPVLLYVKPGITTDITVEMLKRLCPKTEKVAPVEATPVVPDP